MMLPMICLFIAPAPLARDAGLRRSVPAKPGTAVPGGRRIRFGLGVLADAAGFALMLGACYALIRIMELGLA